MFYSIQRRCVLMYLLHTQNSSKHFFLTAILHHGLRNCFFMLHLLFPIFIKTQGCSKGQKSGGAGNNAARARRRCPAAPSDLTKSGGAAAPPAPSLAASLRLIPLFQFRLFFPPLFLTFISCFYFEFILLPILSNQLNITSLTNRQY